MSALGLALTSEPPSDVILPSVSAEDEVIPDISAVVNTGIDSCDEGPVPFSQATNIRIIVAIIAV
jgi:hypothetical protein